jgi:hypothetical protein
LSSYEANPNNPDGSGGVWHFDFRRMTVEELHQVEAQEQASTTSSSAPPTDAPANSTPTSHSDTGSHTDHTQNEERSFWSRGGSALVMGGVLLAAGIFTIATAGAGTPALLVAMGYMGVAGGAAMVGGGGALLDASYAGRTTAAEDKAVSDTLHDVGALSSPFGAAGGVIGYAVNGREGMRTGAAIGNVAHLGQGLVRFGAARLAPGTTAAFSAAPEVVEAAQGAKFSASISRGVFGIAAHGGPGVVENAAGAAVPISDLAPMINGSSAGRIVLLACDVGQDANGVQALSNATGRSIRAFQVPISNWNVNINNVLMRPLSAGQVAQYICSFAPSISRFLNFKLPVE